ncbi:ABC transporter ATP-binding protein [Candidatus Microgenomates bacterium]|nr:ABC transporter ATP-binding protein [Candidatus Microgenomates bacterium]
MLKNIKYAWKVLQIYYKAYGIWSIIDIISQLYGNTLYPFIQIFLLSKLIDALTKNTVLSVSDISWMGMAFIISSLIKIALLNTYNTRGAMNEYYTSNYLYLEIDKKLASLDPATFENPQFQKLLAQMESVKGSIGTFYLRIVALIDSLFKFLTAAVVVSSTFPIFVPIIVFATIPSYLTLNKYRDRLWPYFSTKSAPLYRLSEYVKTLLSSDSTSKETAIFQNADELVNKVKRNQDTYMKSFAKANDSEMIKVILGEAVQFTAFLYTQWLNISKVLAHELSIGQFTLFFQQTLNLSFGAIGILDNYSSMSMRNKFIDAYFEFMDTKRVITTPPNPIQFPPKPTPPTIECKNISFRYPNTERDILKDFNLTINSGEKIALVGENGAGKTTLIKLLLRFYDVTEGELLINGINIKDLDLKRWYEYVGALFQDFIKYQFTFKENVIYGNLGRQDDMELLRKAIEKSGADAILENLPDQFNQTVGKMFENGIDLSGGQWQKLALARAFFRDAPILILDEPTSAIDAKAEYEIFEKVQKLQKDKTVIIISHRFSTVRNADRIIVVDEGRIIEEGNHKELIKENGLYAELFNIQARGYK